MEAKHSYEFGPFRLEPQERRLLRRNQPVSLTPKCFDLLVVFVENSGHLLEKNELLEQLWPGQFVEESNLSFNVSSLRKALGEGENGQRFIETVPKKGFRFVALVNQSLAALPTEAGGETEQVEVKPQIPPSHLIPSVRLSRRFRILVGLITAGLLVSVSYSFLAKRPATAVHKPLRIIAVLPFKPLSLESRDESLEMGMAETLITKLGNIKQLVVKPISAVSKFKELQQDPIKAGQEVQAEAVLDGSIQKTNGRVRVTVRLMNVETGTQLWAEPFDADSTDIFNVQDSISQRVVQALMIKLSGEESAQLNKHSTENVEAYQLYLLGHYFAGKSTGNRSDNFRKSFEYYQLAVEKDPKFAPAYVGISEFYISAGGPTLQPWERIQKAKASILKALELDNTLAEAFDALAELKYQYEFDWAGAEGDFKRAIDLNPNLSYSHLAYSWFLMCQARFDQAQAELDKAQQIEPGSLHINKTQGILFLFMRQFDKAISHYQTMRAVEPALIHRNHWSMSVAYERMGMPAEAVEEFLEDGRIREFLKPEEIHALREAFRTSGWQGYARMRMKMLEEKAKKEYVPPTTLAGIHALAGEKEPAFGWIEKAIDIHDPWLSLIKIQPAYDNLRSDPRFPKMLQRLNLTP